jgi:outer membrane protein OmpA-like peptidoglycan-associated protein
MFGRTNPARVETRGLARFFVLGTLIASGVFAVSLAHPNQASAAGECPAGWTFNSSSNSCEVTLSSYGTASVTVPASVTSVTVDVNGAQGGRGGRNSTYYGDSNRGLPGNVGRVSGELSVTSGDVLAIYVGSGGGEGATGCGSLGYCIGGQNGQGGSGGSNPLGLYNGGGGASQEPADWSGGGGGGGAATVVKKNAAVIIVASGGGGGGGGAGYGSGGTGDTGRLTSGTNGLNGNRTGSGDGGGGGGGGGGTQGGLGGYAGSGDGSGTGGSAGSSTAASGLTASFISARAGSAVISYALAPLVTVSPTVPSSITAPVTVSGSQGTWTGASSYAYQWLRCTASASASSGSGGFVEPAGCTVIGSATSLAYSPSLSDLGAYLRLAVTATNSTGSTTAYSATSSAVVLSAPTVDLVASSDTGVLDSDNLTRDSTPTFSATNLAVGADVVFTAIKGSETQTCGPLAVTAVTQSCTFGELVDGTWSVTAQQSSGANTSAASSAVSTVIDTSRPTSASSIVLASASDSGASSTDRNTSDSTPSITLGGLEVGSRAVVTASKPGSADVTCEIPNVSSAVEACTFSTPLADGTWSFSVEQFDDAGNASTATSGLEVTIDTSAGVTLAGSTPATGTSATALSSFAFRATLTDPPAGATSFTSSDITIGGTSTGWSVDPASWVQVSSTVYDFVVRGTTPSQGTLSVAVPSGSYQDLAGNTATASNTMQSTIVVAAPTNSIAPAISATAGTTTTLGSTLSSTTGTWNDKGDINPTTAVRWQVCPDATGIGCTDISGAQGSTFVPTSSQLGLYVRSVVTRTNVAGATEASSTPVGPMGKSNQQINFTNPGTKTYAANAFSIAPTSTFPSSANSTGLTVAVASQTPSVCTISGFSVTTVASGTCTLVATQPGDAQFNAATQVTQTFTINRANESPVTTLSTSQVEPGQSVILTTDNASAGAVTYAVVSGPCTINGNQVLTTGTGNCIVSTSIASDDRYNSSTPANVTLQVRNIDALTVPLISDSLLSAGDIPLTVTTLSGRTPSVTAGPSGVCSYNSGTGKVVAVGAGTCTVTSSVVDNGTWTASSVTRTFAFAAPPSAPTISSVTTNGSDLVEGASAKVSFTPGALNGSTLVDYSVLATPAGAGSPVSVRCAASPCTVTGLTPGSGYTFTVTANAMAAGNAVTSAPSSASSQVTVKTPHQITLTQPGTHQLSDAPFAVQASSTADASWVPTITSATPGVCTISGSLVTIVGAGTCTLTASHVGGTSSSVQYGYGTTTVNFVIAGPSANDSLAVSTSVCSQVESAASICYSDGLLAGDTAEDSITGIGGGDGSGSTVGFRSPPPPTRISVTRQPNGGAIAKAIVRQDKPQAPVRSVVFVVFDEAGTPVKRVAVTVPAGETLASVRLPEFKAGYEVRAYTTNEAGVSDRAPIGANVLKRPTTLGKRSDGTPILFGKRIARPVQFDPNSPELDERAMEVLDGVVRYAARNGGRVFVTGFVRNQGGIVADQKALSSARAQQVAMYLSKQGVDTWIRFNGYGAYREGQGLPGDRRVEVRWSNQELPVMRGDVGSSS